MSVKSLALRQQRKKIAEDMAALIPAEGVMTPEVREKFNKMDAETVSLKATIDAEERSEALAAELATTQRPPEARVGDAPVETQAAVAEYRNALKRRGLEGMRALRPEVRAVIDRLEARYWEAFRRTLIGKGIDTAEDRAIMTQADPEFRDMGVAVNTLGGYFVPQGFVYEIEEAMKWYGEMLQVADVFDTASGQTLPWPTDNDTTNTGEIVAEGVQVSDQDVSVGHLNFGAYKFSTKMVKFSIELLQDSAFAIEPYLKDKFAIRLGRILNTKLTVGSGTGEPNGIVTAAVAENGTPQVWGAGSGPGIPVIAAGSSANDGGSETGGTSIGSSDLVNLEHSVDRAYRKGAMFMFHDTTLRFLKTLLDKYGRPLWRPGMATKEPDTINDYPFSVNNDMAQIAVSNVTVLFGALKKYKIRRVKELGVMVLVERFADYGQRAAIGFARYDGNLLDAGTHPVNYLKQAAS